MQDILDEIELAFNNFVIDTQAIIDEAKKKAKQKGSKK